MGWTPLSSGHCTLKGPWLDADALGLGYASVCESRGGRVNTLEAIDLHDVGAYLRSRDQVDERHLPYYNRWLPGFFAGPGGDQRLVLV
jgi:hypothetical protein